MEFFFNQTHEFIILHAILVFYQRNQFSIFSF